MDTSQWSQEVGLMNGLEGNNGTGTCSKPTVERKVRAHVQNTEQAMNINCPRCSSTNTKFCYYNNYSLSQPRYLCKTCRRYWTEGGSLRNIPVGGGSRKNRRSSTSSSSAAAAAAAVSSHKLIPDLNPPTLSHFSSQNTKIHGGQDLNLGFSATQDFHYGFPHQFVKLPKAENNDANIHHISSSSSSTPHSLSALELLRTGIACGGLTSFMPMPMPTPDSNTLYTPVFPLQESKPTLSFSADGSGTRYGSSFHGVQENGTARVMFPFGAPKEFQSSSEVDDQTKGQANSTGYWNGRLGGEAW